MDMSKLTRYHTNSVGMNGHVEMFPFHTGDWVKSEEAAEASSNSLQQLKAEIAALVQRYESADRKVDFAIWFRTQIKRLRQLSAV